MNPLGASPDANGVKFGVWAPGRQLVEVEFSGGSTPSLALTPHQGGIFEGYSHQARAGDLYRFRLDGEQGLPDPYSRQQPMGPHGPSRVIDSGSYQWGDAAWQGLDPAHQIIYELHIGSFTDAGSFESASRQFKRVRDLGATCIEIMPVNEFAGRFGWGYDGVNWFAPFHHYGDPDDLRSLVDCAHQMGLGVILDVVYNHFGHIGNYLSRFATQYFTDQVSNPWGAAPNYACEAMRRLAIDNAAYWIREFHFDGLRLDAIQNIHDPAAPTLLASIASEARAAAGSRRILIAAEDFLQRTPLLGSNDADPSSISCLWNDDFHHACRVALTGNHYGFFKNYRGTAQEILSSLKHGFLFQGQFDAWSNMRRGFPVTQQPLHSFIAFTQNHDAVANTLHGQRLQSLTDPGKYRALTAVLLLGPQTPLIFMGQEFGASTPFAYFADDPEETGALWNGRRKEAQQFLPYQDPAALAQIMNPCSPQTLRASTLNHAERDSNSATTRLFADLIALRRRFHVPVTSKDVAGALLTDHAFVFRWFDDERGGDRLLLVNLGPQLEPRAWPEPLLAPPLQRRWQQLWSSDSLDYGGMGAIDVMDEQGLQLTAHSAYFLHAVEESSRA